MLFQVRHDGRDVAVRFERCGGDDKRMCLDCADGSTVSVHRRGTRWVLAVLRGDVAKYTPAFRFQADALHAAAQIYLRAASQLVGA